MMPDFPALTDAVPVSSLTNSSTDITSPLACLSLRRCKRARPSDMDLTAMAGEPVDGRGRRNSSFRSCNDTAGLAPSLLDHRSRGSRPGSTKFDRTVSEFSVLFRRNVGDYAMKDVALRSRVHVTVFSDDPCLLPASKTDPHCEIPERK